MSTSVSPVPGRVSNTYYLLGEGLLHEWMIKGQTLCHFSATYLGKVT